MTDRRTKREARRNRAYARAMLWASLGALAVAGLLFMARTPVDELSRSTPKQVMREHTEAQEAPSVATTLPPMPTQCRGE